MTDFISEEIRVLDKGFVRLDGCMAEDLSVVNSARVSFAKRSQMGRYCAACGSRVSIDCQCELPTWNYRLSEQDAGLIRYLMENRHGTPFEHNAFRLHVKAPLFVFREWQRHRIGSFNEWSARYSEMKPEFYMPDVVRSQTGKPGAYEFKDMTEMATNVFNANLQDSYFAAYQNYRDAIEDGVAKELARLHLPVGIYSEMFWTVNARSLMNFLSLRMSEHAMFEIRQYAETIDRYIFAEQMPVTYEAFHSSGMRAP